MSFPSGSTPKPKKRPSGSRPSGAPISPYKMAEHEKREHMRELMQLYTGYVSEKQYNDMMKGYNNHTEMLHVLQKSNIPLAKNADNKLYRRNYDILYANAPKFAPGHSQKYGLLVKNFRSQRPSKSTKKIDYIKWKDQKSGDHYMTGSPNQIRKSLNNTGIPPGYKKKNYPRAI